MILDSYRFIEATHLDILNTFLQIKDIGSIDQFIEYYKQISKNGLCSGYTYALLKQVANNPKAEIDALINSIDMFDVIKNQLINHVATEVNNDFSKNESLHICCDQCTCRKTKNLMDEVYNLPGLFAINSLAGSIEGFKLEKSTGTFYDLYNNHLSSLGFVPKEKLKRHGNPPRGEMSDDEVMTEEEKNELKKPTPLDYRSDFFGQKKLKDKLIKRKMEYITKNTEAIDLEKFAIAGEIGIEYMNQGHSMFYKFQKNNILFFDSSRGFYLYPSTKTFCNGLKELIK